MTDDEIYQVIMESERQEREERRQAKAKHQAEIDAQKERRELAERRVEELPYTETRKKRIAQHIANCGGDVNMAMSVFFETMPERVDLDDPELVTQQIENYFAKCAEAGIKPGMEGVCNAIGCTRDGLFKRRNGTYKCNPETRVIFEQISQNLASLHEFYGLHGKLNPATFIFLAKNNYGYKDNVDIQLSIEEKKELSADDIRRKYLIDTD